MELIVTIGHWYTFISGGIIDSQLPWIRVSFSPCSTFCSIFRVRSTILTFFFKCIFQFHLLVVVIQTIAVEFNQNLCFCCLLHSKKYRMDSSIWYPFGNQWGMEFIRFAKKHILYIYLLAVCVIQIRLRIFTRKVSDTQMTRMYFRLSEILSHTTPSSFSGVYTVRPRRARRLSPGCQHESKIKHQMYNSSCNLFCYE